MELYFSIMTVIIFLYFHNASNHYEINQFQKLKKFTNYLPTSDEIKLMFSLCKYYYIIILIPRTKALVSH